MESDTQAEAIILTPTAVEAVRSELSKHALEGKALRLFVDPGGCNGYRYGMSPASQVHASDHRFEFGGVQIVVDPESFAFVRGSTIDFVHDQMDGDFRISNPNAVWSCRCGKSFRTADMPATSHAAGHCGCK